MKRGRLTDTYGELQFLRSSNSHPIADYKARDPTWLARTKGEIVYTDGVLVSATFSPNNSISFLFCFVTSVLTLSRNRVLSSIHGDGFQG